MLLDPPAVAARSKRPLPPTIRKPCSRTWPTRLPAAGSEIPYSTITAIDFAPQPPLGPFMSPDGQPIGPLADDEIVLNTWAAEDLGVEPGAEIEITYFEPESTHGAGARVEGQVPPEGDRGPDGPGGRSRPDAADAGRDRSAVDRRLGCAVSVRAGPRAQARTKPTGTSIAPRPRRSSRWPPDAGCGRAVLATRPPSVSRRRTAKRPPSMAGQLQLDPATFGFEFMPVKRLGLAAAAGTTPFDALFLGFSLFIMISALLLVALLFRLGIEQRAEEIGILRAVGLRNRKVTCACWRPRAWSVAAAGSLVGRGGGRGLCLADAGRLEHLVAGRHQHAVSRAVRHAAKPADRLCQRRDRVAADDRLDAAAAGPVSVRRLLAGQTARRPLGRRDVASQTEVAAAALLVLAGRARRSSPADCGARRRPARSWARARWCWRPA